MKPFALARVLQLAERQIEKQAREVKLAHGVWLRARGRQVRLASLRDAHVTQLAGALRAGLRAEQLLERDRLLRARAAEMQAAHAAIAEAHAIWQARLDEWKGLQKRVRALQLLEARHRDQIAIVNRRVDQRQHDELVELMHGRAVAGLRGR